MQIPEYWKTSCDYVDEVYMNAKKASEKRILTHSGGNGPVYMLAYGPKRIHPSAAYYSSALGAMDRTCFATPDGRSR